VFQWISGGGDACGYWFAFLHAFHPKTVCHLPLLRAVLCIGNNCQILLVIYFAGLFGFAALLLCGGAASSMHAWKSNHGRFSRLNGIFFV
jgi:hypothetical protein